MSIPSTLADLLRIWLPINIFDKFCAVAFSICVL
jgi:hypothetical protein